MSHPLDKYWRFACLWSTGPENIRPCKWHSNSQPTGTWVTYVSYILFVYQYTPSIVVKGGQGCYPMLCCHPQNVCVVELQRMFEHSNIIRLRFSRTNFFYERTFVDARWSIFGSNIAERSFGLARGAMHARRYSWNLALTLVMSRRAAEKEAVLNINFQLEEKRERQSFLSFKHLSGRNLKQFVCFAPGIVCSGLKQAATGDAWGSILLGLVWLISGSSKSFICMERTTCSSCALCALCRQASYTYSPATPTLLSSLGHEEGAGAGSFSSFAVPLTTNDMEKSSAQAFATTTDWQSNGVSNRRSTRRLDKRLSGTRTGVCAAESCAKRPTASRWWTVTRRSLKWCMTRLGKFSSAGDNGVVDTVQDEADEKKTPLPESKILPILREVLTLQSSLSAKASVGAAMLCLQKQGQPSPGVVWEWWAGRRSVRPPRDDLPCSKADSRILYGCIFKIPAFLSKSTGLFRAQTPILLGTIMSLNQRFLIWWITVSDK